MTHRTDTVFWQHATSAFDTNDGCDDAMASPEQPIIPVYMARNMVNHQVIPATFRRLTPQEGVDDTAGNDKAVRGRNPDDANTTPSLVLINNNDWIEEDHEEAGLSLSASVDEHISQH
ncbi:hypothetical protein CYMTET_12407 [Cymbomonas tetramitiformis]|uniref:Uncharacterized protein n=1 Tax=Cymbomonas tetramitiformis TaxID=36881 RepID=A0AAE0GK72_9CHLO|nr:hypothetical protein CYMTET_12407 [Cymbomonas tetramitiformis]|eukprot:gene27562-34003_t